MTHVLTRGASPPDTEPAIAVERDPADPDFADPAGNTIRLRLLLPLHDKLRAGLARVLDELRLAGVSQAEVVRRGNARLRELGLQEGMRASILAALKTGTMAITVERLAQIEASQLVDIGDLLVADDEPTRAQLALVLAVLVSTLEGVPGFEALIEGDSPAKVAWREALRMRDGAVRVATRAQAIDDRIAEAAAQRASAQASRARAAGPIVAGGAS